jgi:hypothetical protein
VKFGANPKKLAVLGGLLLVLAYVFFFMSEGDEPPQSQRPAATRPAADAGGVADSLPPVQARRTTPAPQAAGGSRDARANLPGEFRPSLRARRPEDRPDPLTVDPTLRLDLLAKMQNVNLQGGERSLFDFAQPPAPKLPEPKIPVKPLPARAADLAKAAVPAISAPPAKPKAPPIPLKFYGFVSSAPGGPKRAFFLDGDDILVASEGDLVKKRYKVVRIGVNSVVMEDTQFKDQQTLGLVAELQG